MAGGGKTSTSSSSVQIPQEILARYGAVNQRAEQAASQPFQTYSTNPAAFVTPITGTEQAGIQNINAAAGMAQPYYQNAAGLTMGGAGAVNPGELMTDKYMNPYVRNVFDTMVQSQNQQNAQQRSGLNADAIKAGAFGGSRSGVAQANLAYQQNLANQQAQANVLQQGYTQAQNVAQQQQGLGLSAAQANLARQMQAGQQLAGIGQGAQASALAGGQAQLAAGAVPRQVQQAGQQALYNQFLQERSYPFQIAQFLANIAMGTGALSGSTTTATQPLGLLAARGGRIERAGGGLIPSSMGGAVNDWNFGQGFAEGGAPEVSRAPVAGEDYRGYPAYEVPAAARAPSASDAPVYDTDALYRSLGLGSAMFPAMQFAQPTAAQMQADFSLIDPASMGWLSPKVSAPTPAPKPYVEPTAWMPNPFDGYFGAEGGLGGNGQTGVGGSNAPDAQAFADGGVASGLPYGVRGYVPEANLPVGKLMTSTPPPRTTGLIMSPVDALKNVQAIKGLWGAGKSAISGLSDLMEPTRERADGGEVEDEDGLPNVTLIDVPTQQFFPTHSNIPSMKVASAPSGGGGGGLMGGLRGLAGTVGAVKTLGGLLPFADGGMVRNGYEDGGVPERSPYDLSTWSDRPSRITNEPVGESIRRLFRSAPAPAPVGLADSVASERDIAMAPPVENPIPAEPSGRGFGDVMADLRGNVAPSPPPVPAAPERGLMPMAPARDVRVMPAVAADPDVPAASPVAAVDRGEGVVPRVAAEGAPSNTSPDWMERNQSWLVPLLTGLQGMRGARGPLGALIGAGAAAAAGYESTQNAMAQRARSAAETEAIPQRLDIDRQKVQLDAIAKNMAVLENLKQLAASYTAQGQPIPETLRANIAALTDRLAGSVQAAGGAGGAGVSAGPVRTGAGGAGDADGIFARMIGLESNGQQFDASGNPLRSPAGAIGVAQVMPTTGPEAAQLAGLPWDENRYRNDREYNLAIGRAYYDEMNRRFGNPLVAAAAYNAGPRAVSDAMTQAQRNGGSYLDYLPRETQRYVANLSGARVSAQPGVTPPAPQAGDEQRFFSQLSPDYNPQELMRRANATRAFNPAEADRLRDRAMAVQSDIETKGYGIGPDGKQVPFPGFQEAKTAQANAVSNPKLFEAEANQYNARRETANSLQNIAHILETYEPGMFAQEKANIIKSLESVGVNVPAEAMESASSFDAFVKSQMKTVFQNVAAIGGQVRVAELSGLERAGNAPTMAPEANRKVLGDAVGILRYADKRYNDMIAGRDNPEYQTGGVFDPAKFEKVWAAKPENNIRMFVEEARKSYAVRGATPSDPSKLVPGQAYILDRSRVPGLPGDAPSRKATFVGMDDRGKPVFDFPE